MSFYALEFSFEKIYFTFAVVSDKFFWTRLKEKAFEVDGKWLEHLEKRENLCLHSPKTFINSAGPGYESIRCLNNNKIDCLFELISHSTNDRRVQTLQLESNQLALVRVSNVH